MLSIECWFCFISGPVRARAPPCINLRKMLRLICEMNHSNMKEEPGAPEVRKRQHTTWSNEEDNFMLQFIAGAVATRKSVDWERVAQVGVCVCVCVCVCMCVCVKMFGKKRLKLTLTCVKFLLHFLRH